ncbi:LOW QUALITY PROTEIN: amino acid transporter heavy chain SLC3A2, partial [Aegotheles albertisi]
MAPLRTYNKMAAPLRTYNKMAARDGGRVPPPGALSSGGREAADGRERRRRRFGGGGAPPQLLPPPAQDPPQGEKNGLAKLPADEEVGGVPPGGSKFTGLGKEELLRAAGTPPWAKARGLLLLIFWLGWLGMLGAAAAIVARAPRCQPLPPRAWWQLGGLYRAPPAAFGGDLKGVEAGLEHVAGLQMRGLVLGPLHPKTPPGAPPQDTPLEELDPALGTLEDFEELLKAAKKK